MNNIKSTAANTILCGLCHKLSMLIVLVSIVLSPEILSGESASDLESALKRLSVQLDEQTSQLDSLKKRLELQARRIDMEKEKSPADKEHIKLLMAQSVTLADQIEDQQQIITETEKKFENVRKELLSQYENSLDSLREVKLKSSDDESAAEVQNQILEITRKKLLIQPDPAALSFDPGKIVRLKVDSETDIKTKKLYLELIETALAEVHQKREVVGEILQEIGYLNELNSMTQRFVERSDLASGPPGSAAAVKQGELQVSSEIRDTFDGAKSVALPQIDTYVHIWQQLDQLPALRKSEWISPVDSSRIYSSPQEFYTLLNDLDTRLDEYEKMLRQMINAAQ